MEENDLKNEQNKIEKDNPKITEKLLDKLNNEEILNDENKFNQVIF